MCEGASDTNIIPLWSADDLRPNPKAIFNSKVKMDAIPKKMIIILFTQDLVY